MKTRILQLAVVFLIATSLKAQDLGKIVIRNAAKSYPEFIASLNGVRLTKAYSQVVSFDFLEENFYRVKILQAGSSKVLSFNVSNAPNYISKYILNQDNAGMYSLVLESKSLLTAQTEVITTEPAVQPAFTHTGAPEPGRSPVVGMPNVSPVYTNEAVTGPQAMPDNDYNGLIKAVKKESLEHTRLDMAKTFFAEQYLSSAQVTGILKVFSVESSRLTFAKFAYSRTVDKSNYFKVYDAFSLSSSKREMSEYIKNNP